MNLSGKLIVAFVVLGASIALLSVLAVTRVERGLRDLGETHTPALLGALEIQTGFGRAIEETLALVVTRDPENLMAVRRALADVDDQIARLRAIDEFDRASEPREVELAREIAVARQELERTSVAMLESLEREGTVDDALLARHETLAASVAANLLDLIAFETAEVEGSRAYAASALATAQRLLWAIVVISFICPIVLGLLLSRMITGRLGRLASAAAALRTGAAQHVPTAGRDEISALARVFNEMAADVTLAQQSLEGAVRHRTRELESANGALRTLVEHAPEAIVVLDMDSRRLVEVNANATRLFDRPRSELLQMSPVDLSPKRQPDGSSSRRGVEQQLARALAGETPVFEWVHLDRSGNAIDCEIRLVRLPSSQGRLVRGSLTDIRERKRHEQRQRLMMRELDHRVKNNLTAVLGLCQHTLAHATDLDEFATSFVQRIHAMARTHEALARARWSGMGLDDTVQLVLHPYAGVGRGFAIAGEAVVLPTRIASPLSLALHELATNAAKHGALSTAEGHVDVKWRRPDQHTISLQWIERGGPPAPLPTSNGVGLDLLTGLIEHEIGGTVALQFDDNGLICDIELPT